MSAESRSFKPEKPLDPWFRLLCERCQEEKSRTQTPPVEGMIAPSWCKECREVTGYSISYPEGFSPPKSVYDHGDALYTPAFREMNLFHTDPSP